MTNDQKEVLELAKKCGILQFDIQNEFVAFPISINDLRIFADALEEKHRAEIAMLTKNGNAWVATTEAVSRIAGFCDNAESNYSNPTEYRDKLASAFIADDIAMKEFIKTLSATQQDTDAFLEEVRAKAKLEGKIEALEEAATEYAAQDDDILMREFVVEWITNKAATLRNSAAQQEGKEVK